MQPTLQLEIEDENFFTFTALPRSADLSNKETNGDGFFVLNYWRMRWRSGVKWEGGREKKMIVVRHETPLED